LARHTTGLTTMTFTRFVEIGRVCLINYGPDAGKLCTIIDIVDANKCLVEGPPDLTGVIRQVLPYKRIALTDLKVKIPKNARQKTVKAAWEKSNVLAKWENTVWAKKLAAKKKRAAMTDFERFQLMVARKQKAALVAEKLKAIESGALVPAPVAKKAKALPAAEPEAPAAAEPAAAGGDY